MKQLTFTQKLWRQGRFFSSLIPILALLVGLGASHTTLGQQASYNFDNVTIRAKAIGGTTTSSTIYDGTYDPAAEPPYNPLFEGADLGDGAEFDQALNASELKITAAAASLGTKSISTVINSSSLFYRVYLNGATVLPAYSEQKLTQRSASNTGDPVTFDANGLSIDLLNAGTVLGGGTYTVELVFSSEITTKGRNGSSTTRISDPSNVGGAGFQATFRVKSPVSTPTGGTTTWQSSTGSRDWTLPSNWSNGVPTATSNAIIPERQEGIPASYPLLDSPTQNYEVNNLTLVGQSNSRAGLLTIETATLTVYGNLRQNSGGLKGTVTGAPGMRNAALNSTLILAGGNQIVTGRLSVPDIIIAGTNIKSVTGVLLPTNTLSFRPADVQAGVIVQSAFEDQSSGSVTPVFFDTTLLSLINLEGTGIINQEPGYAETNVSYVKGVLRSNRQLVSGVKNTFGNIGVDFTANYSTVPEVIIFRVVGDPLQSPTSQNGRISKPIKRQYIVDNTLNSEDPRFTGAMFTSTVFHYLDSPDELNGITESNLTMYRSRENGPPYAPIFGDLDTANNTITRTSLPSFSRFTLTLGDITNPLPVRLTAFDVKRLGNDALITWQTASEINSKGYEVQVSANGTEFRPLQFVASASPNSTRLLSYSYVDKEASKAGTRYYRLRQVDIDGKEEFFAPKSVSFEGKVAAASLVAYPNPFTSTDELHVTVQLTKGGKGQLRVTDMTGRTIRQESVELASGIADITVGGTKDLKAGIYLVRLTLPSGETQNLKVVKQ